MSDTTHQSIQSRNDGAQHADVQPEAVRRELFLDLEDTVITPVVNGWHDFELLNVQKIREVISGFQPAVVNLFSFAVWNQRELRLFNEHCRPHIERALGITFNLTPTVDDHITPACCREMCLPVTTVEFHEMSAFWGKQGAFRHFAREHARKIQIHRKTDALQPVHLLLLDDAVVDERLVWRDLAATIEQRNIDRL